jgi:hypothetical protein
MRGGAMPRSSGGGIGGGFTLGSRPPTRSTWRTSSMSWPEGVSKRIDSPCPTASPRATRRTGKP